MKTLNPSNIKKAIKITALFIIAAFLITVYTPVQAEAAALKEEVVYVRLNNDGSLSQVYVVNSFQLGQDNEILDYGNYKYVRNLTDSSEIKLENGKVTLEANGDQLYYEGYLIKPQLPWNISIKYFLEGKEIPPEELAGKSGHLVIRMETTENPLGNREFYDSYALQIALTFDSSLSKNITAEGGTVASAGSDKQVNYVALPGKEASFELSSDVENFEMSAITIAGVRLKMDYDIEDYDMSELNKLSDGIAELDDGVQELLDGIFDMKKGINDLHDGTIELGNGVGEFKDGIKGLSEGTGKLKGGIAELKDGTTEMAAGALELVDGSTELVDGVKELDNGVGEFADGIGELNNGMKELESGISRLSGGMNEITDGSANLNSGAAALASGAAAAASSGARLAGGFDAYFDGIIGLVNAQLAGSGLPTLDRTNYSAVLENAAKVPGNPQAQELLGLLEMLKSYDQLLAGLNGYVSGVNEISSGTSGLSAGVSKFHDGLVEYGTGLSKYQSGITQFSQESYKLAAGANELKEGTTKLLNGVIGLKDGIVEFKDGAVELRDGVIELFNGIVVLHNGVIEMNDGAIEINDGIIELIDGVGELKDGTNDLYDGVAELKDGTGEFSSETESLDTKISDATKEEIDKMMGSDAPVKSFVSEKNGEISAVQFVIQTEGISIPEVKEADIGPEPEPTFWQRFISLFGF